MDHRIIIFLFVLVFAGCNPPEQVDDHRFYVVTTTGMIEDAVANIGQDRIHVESIMGPGVDPHLYKATQGDLTRLQDADLIFYNGLKLEGKLGEVLGHLKQIKPVVAVSSDIPESKLKNLEGYEDTFDPHIWFDVSLWKLSVQKVGETLIRQDTINADFYKENMNEYLARLDSLHAEVTQQIATIPEQQRVLITAHDAFGYFGEAYNIEVKGLQGVSTLSEPGIRDIKELVDFIVERQIKAVFVETSVSEKSIKAVVEGARQRGFDVQIGGNLFSDAMGQKGTEKGTYIGMVRSNVKTMVESLK